MYILGLHNVEDAGVCLMRDGVILEAVNEERFSRTKLHHGVPERSLSYVLDKYSLSLDDIAFFAYGWHGRQNDYLDYARRLTHRVIEAMRRNPECGPIIEERLAVEISRDAGFRAEFEEWVARLGVRAERLAFLDHHGCHAWSAFACSPFERALVFTFDGRGDLKSVTASAANRSEGVRELDYLLSFDSLGFLYGQVTHQLGYKHHRHEGKVTGLAAYGNPDTTLPLFRSLIDWEDGRIVARMGPYRPFYTNIDPTLSAEFAKYSREDIAAGAQAHCEDLVVKYVQHWIKREPEGFGGNVCLAGGVAGNVKINQKVAEIPGVDNIFVFPHMGDGGLGAGAAISLYSKLGGTGKVAMPDAYLGPAYGNAEIADSLAGYGDRISFEEVSDPVASVVEDLLAKQVVGYFDGRMEFGPRALGARSILFHARDASVNDWLNKRLRRTEFMPFAPVTPEEFAQECYHGWRPDHVAAHFMTRTYSCTENFWRRHPAVVHIDGTARPQIVSQERNGNYYRVVKAYCERTGDMALINTSFNQHEEPIVRSPQDAVDSLLNGNVDVLACGRFRIVARHDK